MKYNKALAMGMVIAVAGSTVAFAEGTLPDLLIAPTPTTGEAAAEDGEAVTEEETVAAAVAAYTSQSGKVAAVTTAQNGDHEVMIDNETGGLRFMVAADTIIVNREDGTYLTVDQLKEGMEITVVYGANSPMGMSMPPFLGQVSAVIANANAGSVSVGIFDAELLNQTDMLALNIAETTTIQNTQGTKMALTAEDVKNQNAIVFYDVTTRSIPAQTTPSFVLILAEKEETPAAEIEEATAVAEAVRADAEVRATGELIELRDTAEELGYTVTWQGKNKPVLVENETKSIEITIGATTYTVDDTAVEASQAAVLVDGVLFVADEVLATAK